jgi:hypothetical protein
MGLTDLYSVFHLATAYYTFFSGAHGTFSKIDHILGHNTTLNKDKKIEITPCLLSDHNAIKQELNHKRNSRKYSKSRILDDKLLHVQWVIKEKKEGNQEVSGI